MSSPLAVMLFYAIVAVILVFPTSPVHSQDTDGLLSVNGSREVWGHTLKKRTQQITDGARRVWLDFGVRLPAGIVEKFQVYVHANQASSVGIQFLIFYPTSTAGSALSSANLVYSQAATLSPNEGIQSFNIPQPPRLRSGSYVGWTYADNVSPISFDFRDQYRSYYSTLNAGAPGPKVGDTLNFEPISFPAVFSIAATINTNIAGPPGPQGATGPQGPAGPKGDQGSRGDQGPKGDAGSAGAKGDAGQKGDQGSQGPSGPKGDTGDRGAQGIQGIQGPRGLQGPPGTGGGTDTNECATNNGGCQQTCINTFGSFRCECNTGFQLRNDGRTCENINECNLHNGGCLQRCQDNSGSFTCSCFPGFSLALDDKSCLDINECKLPNNNCTGRCVNTPGSFDCIRLVASSSLTQDKTDAQLSRADAPGPSLIGATANTTWLCLLTLLIFITMALSFRAWRYAYCHKSRGSRKRETTFSDTSSVASEFSMGSGVNTISSREALPTGSTPGPKRTDRYLARIFSFKSIGREGNWWRSSHDPGAKA